MADSAELQTLKQRRTQIKKHVTRFVNFIEKIQCEDDPRIKEISLRITKLEQSFADFEVIQDQIESIKDDPENETWRTQFEDSYYAVIAKAKFMANESANSVAETVSNVPTSSEINNTNNNAGNFPQVSIKLPQMSLPEFSGLYDKWAQFRDLFSALIHNNPLLSDTQKLYYLQSSLKGEASQIIQSLEITETNYTVAWDLLKNRFENKKIIIKTHLKNILEAPIVTKDNHASLRQFSDNFQKNYRALENLGESVEHWTTILLYLLTAKLDVNTKREWGIKTNDEVSPSIQTFIDFLSDRCQLLESLDDKAVNKDNNSYTRKSVDCKAHLTTNNTTNNCLFCGSNHKIFQCKEFTALSADKRLQEIRRRRACTNCLRKGHGAQECFWSPCRTCGKKHNTLLHLNSLVSTNKTSQNSSSITKPNTNLNTNLETNANQNTQNNNNLDLVPQTQSNTQQNTNASTVSAHAMNNPFVLLSTAEVFIFDSENQPILCRALLDNGSQSCFISKELCERLNLKTKNIKMPVSGVNSLKTHINESVTTKIESKSSQFQTILNFLVLDQITDNIPQIKLDIDQLNVPSNIVLADNKFAEPKTVDILLGAGVFYDVLLNGKIKANIPGVVFQNTKLGYLATGHYNLAQPNFNTSCNFTQNDLHDQIEKFWAIEETSVESALFSKEEQEVEEHFASNLKRTDSGRFIVKLPTRDNYSQLGDNLNEATKRFLAVEKRFTKDAKLREEYSNFIREYIELGHATCISNSEISKTVGIVHYLPHHAIKKESSLTTKLRVVFDASSKSESKLSLNDVLKTGPNIQDDIFSILLRFREHNVALAADITKMYRQILVDESDRDLQRIVWRFNSADELKHYRLNTITYGTSPASFLATRCLKQLAIEHKDSYPNASKSIEQNFYMDDWVTGARDKETALCLINEVSMILSSAGFELRQYNSNNAKILDTLKSCNNSDIPYVIKDTQGSTKTLGMLWQATDDCFQFITKTESNDNVFTKRQVLSVIAQIFDPLGLIGPVVLSAKILMQQLWKSKTEWDAPLDDELQMRWLRFYNNLHALHDLKIPRHAILHEVVYTEIHCFSDASMQAYGTCIYVKSIDKYEGTAINLLTSKSRVAPLKTVTIPRLELCAALLSAQLSKKVIGALELQPTKVFYWSDSQIVLSWVRADPSNFKTFVSNRISQIQSITGEVGWRYVPTCQNPADLISRGVDPQNIAHLPLWWHGPSYLLENEQNWPENACAHLVEVPETKNKTLIFITKVEDDILQKYSCLKKLTNVLAYLLRFAKNSKLPPSKRNYGSLSVEEVNDGIITAVKMAQKQEFASELHCLKSSKFVPKTSKLYNLNVFLDANGLIRIGGRLTEADLSYEAKHPIVLPPKHHLTTLIIRSEHYRNLHAGCQTVLASIRTKFWLLNGRNTVKRILRKCIVCFKAKPRVQNPMMASLPASRVNPSRPFLIVGTDFAGPFLIKNSKLRNRVMIKAYICIFICFSTKCIHIEAVSDLSTEAFLNALKRFISRRGIPSEIHSDNATSYVGAERHIRKQFSDLIKSSEIQQYLRNSMITWKFIPARSPHFGGLWESAVRSAKYYTKRNFQNSSLTFEEFYTCLTQIESILNSRPLYPLTEDSTDYEVLTPGHFLIGTALNALPEVTVPDNRATHVSRYKYLQLLVQQFWQQWSRNYLNTMQQRTKWQTSNVPERLLGALVLLHEDNVPIMNWKLGRISALYPGSDNQIRVVSVKTANGEVKRALVKLSILPIEADE